VRADDDDFAGGPASENRLDIAHGQLRDFERLSPRSVAARAQLGRHVLRGALERCVPPHVPLANRAGEHLHVHAQLRRAHTTATFTH
jgi:hypothetical protein